MLDGPASGPFTPGEQAAASALAELAGAAVTRLTDAGLAAWRVPVARPGPHGDLASALAAVVSLPDLGEAAETGLSSVGAQGVIIAEQEGYMVHTVARAGFTPVEREQMRAGVRVRKPAGQVLAPRAADYVVSTAELLSRYPHFADFVAGADPHAWSVAALPSGYGAPAACLFAFPPAQPPDGPTQVRLVMLRGLMGQTLDRCRVHDQEHRLVTGLHGTMPGELPGLRLAWRYQPGTPGLSLGGDFYDAFVSCDGTPALVIGDVQGHGPAAAIMAARLGTAIRAYAMDSSEPAEIIGRASRFLAAMNADSPDPLYATCCCLTVDPRTGHGRACRAGHPYPITVTSRGPAVLPAGDGGLPLGVDPDYAYRDFLFTLQPGDSILLYTDGLVDYPDPGSEALVHALSGGSYADPAALVAGLPQFSQAEYCDDIAVLAATYHRLGTPPRAPF
jgi:Stage II sporulation protein E (SpoIIE)